MAHKKVRSRRDFLKQTGCALAGAVALPQGLAKPATEAIIRALAKDKAKRAEHRTHERKRLEEAAVAVEGAEAVLAAKANEQGVLFGSVGAGDIAANLREQGFAVADDFVQLEENIKQDLAATVTVVVVAAGEDTGVSPAVPTEDTRQEEEVP